MKRKLAALGRKAGNAAHTFKPPPAPAHPLLRGFSSNVPLFHDTDPRDTASTLLALQQPAGSTQGVA
eukprot:scaffold12679_cov106-Isochrysis_galbana.AAC.2